MVTPVWIKEQLEEQSAHSSQSAFHRLGMWKSDEEMILRQQVIETEKYENLKSEALFAW